MIIIGRRALLGKKERKKERKMEGKKERQKERKADRQVGGPTSSSV